MSGSDVGLSGIQETNVTSVNVTQETQSLAVRRIYFQHHHADKNFIKFCEISDTRELSSPVWSGQWTHAFVYSDPRSRPLRQITLGGKFDRGETLYQCIKDQYLDQQSIFTLPWVADYVKHGVLELCYPKMIRLHSKTFSGETEKETEGRPFG